MSPAKELEVLAIEVRHLTALAKAMQARLDELTDPHYELRSHAGYMATVVYLCANTQSLVESMARTAKKRVVLTAQDRAQAEEASNRG